MCTSNLYNIYLYKIYLYYLYNIYLYNLYNIYLYNLYNTHTHTHTYSMKNTLYLYVCCKMHIKIYVSGLDINPNRSRYKGDPEKKTQFSLYDE